jgi:Ca-activated chloride channel family protein
MREVDTLTPAGRTPLTSAVEEAADVLDYRNKPGVIVLLTDGEETCGRSPCDLGRQLHATAAELTVHVISYRTENYSWVGESSVLDTKCPAEENNGFYITAYNYQELVEAFEKALDCPMIAANTVSWGTGRIGRVEKKSRKDRIRPRYNPQSAPQWNRNPKTG